MHPQVRRQIVGYETNADAIAHARAMRMDSEVGTPVERERILGELANRLSTSDALIAKALVELCRPIDRTIVQDTHAGRALWGANRAAQAAAILSEHELNDAWSGS